MAAKKKTTSATTGRGTTRETDAKTLSKIQKLAQEALREVQKGQNPTFEIRVRALSNVSFNEKKRIIELGDKTQAREFFNTSMARKFMQTMLVANGCKTLIEAGKTISIRQMYYLQKHTIKGSNENTFDEQNESDPIIEDLEVASDALREELHLFAARKGSMVGNLTINEDKFWKQHNCILMTSGGQATRGTRRLLQRLANELKLPVFVVVDNDPW